MESFHESCKLITKIKAERPPWWEHNLSILRNNERKTKRRYDRRDTPVRLEEWRIARNKYNREIKKAKENGWMSFCSGLEDLTAVAKLQKILKNGKGATLGTLKKPDGEYTDTPEETLKLLLDVHFPDHGTDRRDDDILNTMIDNSDKLDLDSVINIESVTAAINSFRPYKSPGKDGIFPILLQKGLKYFDKKLVNIYKESLRTGIIPGAWLETKVVFIPKPGKTDYCEPKSFRPISLSPFLLKGLERLIFWHINNTTLKTNPFHSNLYSYREGISTEDALHNLIHTIEKH